MLDSIERAAPEIGFIVNIISMAVKDAMRYKSPPSLSYILSQDLLKKVSKSLLMCAEARAFLSLNCRIFRYYCTLIGLDPEWVHRKAWVLINEHDSAVLQRKAA